MSNILRLMPQVERTLAMLPPLTLDVPRVAHTPILGTHGRRKPGQGEAFWEFDEYNPELHETRQIDWHRSTTTEKPVVRNYEWEAAQAAFIWCDNAPEMNFTSDPDQYPTKGDRAKALALTLASALVAAEERVALLGSEDGLTNRVDGFIDSLSIWKEEDDQSWEKLGKAGRPPLTDSTVILISDCLEDPNAIRKAIGRLAQYNVRGHIIQILDPAEVNLPYSGQIKFEGFRGGEREMSRTEDIRRAYYQKMHEHQRALLNICKRVGWNYSCHMTNKPMLDAFAPLYNNLDGTLPTFEDGAAQVQNKGSQKRGGFFNRFRPQGPS